MVIKGVKLEQKYSITNEFKHIKINDFRLIKRINITAETLDKNPESSIPKACQNVAKTKAVYRLLGNPKLQPDIIINSHRKETIKRMKEHKLVLCIQDTCTLDFTPHLKTKGLGPVGTSKFLSGLIMHSALCITTSGVPLGLLAQKIWARDPEKRGKSKLRKQLPIEEKESYKWLETMDSSLKGLPKEITVVTVADREADIYDLFYKATCENKHLLIRATHDRCLAGEQERLFSQIHNSPVQGECLIQLPRNTRLNMPERKAQLVIKFREVEICPPTKNSVLKLPNIKLYAIYAQEISAPEGATPVQWLLLTTLQVENFDQAIEKIRWYCHRWKVERFHYVLKSGCVIENLQLGTSESLKNIIAIYSVLAWKLIWITYLSRETPDAPCTLVLDENEWKVLYCLVNKKSSLPKQPPTLKEAVVLIARLGGFLARKNDGNPGVKVLWRGYSEFNIAIKTLSSLNLSPFS
jgi:hypothetical protein